MQSWWVPYAMMPAIALGAYVWLIFVLRLTGKRSLSKLNAFDFSVTVAFGSALASVIVTESVGLLRGGIALASLALLQYVATKLSLWSKFFRKVVRSRPTLLMRSGQVYREALSYERVTVDELAEAIRNKGFAQLAEVAAVVLETDGSFSVLGGRFEDFDLLYDVRTFGEPSEGSFRERISDVAAGDGGAAGQNAHSTQRGSKAGRT